MMIENNLKIYELFRGHREQNFFAIHTLSKLYADKEYFKASDLNRTDKKKLNKTFNEINNIRNYLNDFSLRPYLILKNLENGNGKGVLEKLTKIIPSLWLDYSEKINKKKIIKEVKNPSKDNKFIKHLLDIIAREENGNEKFLDKSKAEELFLHHAGKEHLELLMKDVKSYSSMYHSSANARESLED